MTEESQFRPVKPVRAYETIVQQLEEAIIHKGTLKPGDRLPSERELMRQFEVGRSTVREALRVLQSNGMVRSRPGDPRGPEVVAFSSDQLYRPMEALLKVGQVSLFELLFYRMMTEGTIVGLVATHGSQDHLDSLRDTFERMRTAESEENLEAFLSADSEFHRTLAAAAESSFLAVQYDVVRDAVRRYLASNMDTPDRRHDYMSRANEKHGRLVEAVVGRRKSEAMEITYETILEHYSVYLSDDEVLRMRAFYLDEAYR
jgi:GntR family transcriptional regulator, transcriptional repressor for pyruvate dehydrogenase complex